MPARVGADRGAARFNVVPQQLFVYSEFTAGHQEDLCVSYSLSAP